MEGSARWNTGDSGHLWNLKTGGLKCDSTCPSPVDFARWGGWSKLWGPPSSQYGPNVNLCQFFINFCRWLFGHRITNCCWKMLPSLIPSLRFKGPSAGNHVLFPQKWGFRCFFYRAISPLKPIQSKSPRREPPAGRLVQLPLQIRQHALLWESNGFNGPFILLWVMGYPITIMES